MAPLSDGLGSERVVINLFAQEGMLCAKGLAKLELNVRSQTAAAFYRGKFKVRLATGDARTCNLLSCHAGAYLPLLQATACTSTHTHTHTLSYITAYQSQASC